MTPYSLAALAKEEGKHKKGSVVTIPGIEERLGSVKQYRTALRKILHEVARETRESVIPLYRTQRAQQSVPLTRDADRSWFRVLNQIKLSLTSAAERTAERVLRLESQRHSKRFREIARKQLGVDLQAVVTREGIDEVLREALERNVALISNLTDDAVRAVEGAVYNASANGHSIAKLRETIQKRLGNLDARADLIAQDQLSKLNSDLNRIRQTQAGVTSYTWRTSQDERVRSRHRTLDGTVYKWGKPTSAEDGLPPGQPIRCRCLALGRVEL